MVVLRPPAGCETRWDCLGALAGGSCELPWLGRLAFPGRGCEHGGWRRDHYDVPDSLLVRGALSGPRPTVG